MKKIYKTLLCTVSMVSALCQASYASQDMELDALLSMDLEELKVSVASKREENVLDAPGVVTVITAEDIRRYGGNTLSDLLQRAPSIFNASSFLSHNNLTSIRGTQPVGVATNYYILMLLNGRPMREEYAGGYNTVIYQGFPLSAIERIEVIRGPGSVLYGSGAFSGVINIVTKKPKEEGFGQTFGYGLGSFNTHMGEYTMAAKHKDVEIFGAINHRNTDGFPFELNNAGGVLTKGSYPREITTGTAQMNYKDLSMSFFTGRSEDAFLSDGLAPLLPAQEIVPKREFADIGYTFHLPKEWKAKLNFTYGSSPLHAASGSVHLDSHSTLYEMTVDGPVTEKLNLLVGATYTDLQGWERSTSFHQVWRSHYVQADYQPWNWVKLIGGAQFNDIGPGSYEMSPRAGTIFHLSRIKALDFLPEGHDWGVKLLYGEAFRSPTAVETTINVPGIVLGNPDLTPETIETFDAQLFYHASVFETSLTYFHSKQKDTITGIFDSSRGLLTFANVVGEVTYQGVEWEGKWRVSPAWTAEGSVSLMENESATGQKDLTLVPNLLAKTGVTYHAGKGVTMGLFNTYIGQTTSRTSLNPSTPVVNPPEKDYHHLTANIELDIPELMRRSDLPPMKFTLFGDNLLESQTVWYPENYPVPVNTMPLYSGRAVYGKFTITF